MVNLLVRELDVDEVPSVYGIFAIRGDASQADRFRAMTDFSSCPRPLVASANQMKRVLDATRLTVVVSL